MDTMLLARMTLRMLPEAVAASARAGEKDSEAAGGRESNCKWQWAQWAQPLLPRRALRMLPAALAAAV
jgi:hypothetical protein